MIKKVSLSFILVFLIIALLLKLSGVDSVSDLLDPGTTKESFYYGFIQEVSKNIKLNPIKIPNIPSIPVFDNLSIGNPLDWLKAVANFFVTFANVNITIINVLSGLINIIVDLLVYIISLFKTIFNYWHVNEFLPII